jgi:hypothetical protein
MLAPSITIITKENPDNGSRRARVGTGNRKIDFVFYRTPQDACKSPNITVTDRSTTNAREWWAAESVELGTDWISVAGTVSAIMHQLAGASS